MGKGITLPQLSDELPVMTVSFVLSVMYRHEISMKLLGR